MGSSFSGVQGSGRGSRFGGTGGASEPDRAIDHFTSAPVASGRVKDTIYQAGTTAVFVSLSLSSVGGVARFEISANDDMSGYINAGDINGSGYTNQAFIVPPGYYYRLNSNSGTLTVNQWVEVAL